MSNPKSPRKIRKIIQVQQQHKFAKLTKFHSSHSNLGLVLNNIENKGKGNNDFKITALNPSKTFIEKIEDNSPADHAGLAVDDFIIHINNIDVSTYSLSEIVSLIRQESAVTDDNDIRGNYLEFHVIHVVKIKKFDSEMVERLGKYKKN